MRSENDKLAQKRWNTAHPEKLKEYSRKWRMRHKKELNEYSNNWLKTHKIHRSYYNTKRSVKLRFKLMDVLGGRRCIRCGFSDWRALQIDHINGGGSKESKQMSYQKRRKFYIDNPELAKQKLQVLCANCNWIKRHDLSEIPYKHQPKKTTEKTYAEVMKERLAH